MSRGYGRIERRILAVLGDGSELDTYQLTARVFDRKPGEDGRCIVTVSEIVKRAPGCSQPDQERNALRCMPYANRQHLWFLWWRDRPEPKPAWTPVVIAGGR